MRESITVESDQTLRKLQEQFQQKHQDIKVQERVETVVLFGQQDRGVAVAVYQGPPAQEETYTDYAFTLGKFRSGTFNPENINHISMPEFSEHKANNSPYAWYSPPFYYTTGRVCKRQVRRI